MCALVNIWLAQRILNIKGRRTSEKSLNTIPVVTAHTCVHSPLIFWNFDTIHKWHHACSDLRQRGRQSMSRRRLRTIRFHCPALLVLGNLFKIGIQSTRRQAASTPVGPIIQSQACLTQYKRAPNAPLPRETPGHHPSQQPSPTTSPRPPRDHESLVCASEMPADIALADHDMS